MRLALALTIAAGVASAQHDAGLVWHGLRAGWTASNAVHNSIDGHVGNTRGPITETPGGAVSNNSATASWVGWGTNYNPMATASQLTMVGWVKRGSAANAWSLCGNAPSTGGSNMALIVAASATRTYLYIQPTASSYRYIDVSGHANTLRTNEWVQIGATWAGGTNLCLYVDGIQYRTGVGSAGTPSNTIGECLNQEWRLGAFSNGANTMINSNALWNWRVYNRALASNEITHLRITDRRLLP